MITVFYF